ncbi:MAG TPA: hypothetical protein VF698_03340, partial [Thermoanaerobaculia bacterium]
MVIPAVPGPTDDPAMKHASDDRAWSTGLNDGMLGQTWREQRRVLEFEAESVRLDATCRIDQQLEDARAAERLAVEAHAREKATFEKIGAQLSATTADRAGHPSSYSRLLGSVYIAFAMLLIAADFPLTREVANTIGIS